MPSPGPYWTGMTSPLRSLVPRAALPQRLSARMGGPDLRPAATKRGATNACVQAPGTMVDERVRSGFVLHRRAFMFEWRLPCRTSAHFGHRALGMW